VISISVEDNYGTHQIEQHPPQRFLHPCRNAADKCVSALLVRVVSRVHESQYLMLGLMHHLTALKEVLEANQYIRENDLR
jgi:hypothetical protein